MFDPYHKWLGIAKDEQPPTHYRLLGIRSDETDPDVIDEAAVRQTTHLRSYQLGPHASECTRILNEIARAKSTLLNPAKRKEYDAQLPRKQGESETTPSQFAGIDSPSTTDKSKKPAKKAKVEPKNPLLLWGGMAGGVFLLAGLAFAFWPRSGNQPVAKKKDQEAPKPPVVIAKKPEPIPVNPPPPTKKPEVVKPEIEKPPQVGGDGNYALAFDGREHVLLPSLHHQSGPFTIECRFAIHKPFKAVKAIFCNAEQSGLDLHVYGLKVKTSAYVDKGYAYAASNDELHLNQLYHVAAVADGNQLSLFLDGKKQGQVPCDLSKYRPSKLRFVIGGNPFPTGQILDHFAGSVDELRFSKVPRYQEDFTPSPRFEPDSDTIALYHFDEGQGNVLRDSSGNHHDGEIVGARWIKSK